MIRLYFLCTVMSLLCTTPVQAKLLANCTNIKGKLYALTDKPGWTNQRAPIKALLFYKSPKKPLEIYMDDGYTTRNILDLGARLTVLHAARDYSWFIASANYRQLQTDNFQLIFDEKNKGHLIWTRMRLHTPPQDRSDTAMFIGQCTR